MLKIIANKFEKTQICGILYQGLGNPKSVEVTVFRGCKDNIFTGSKFIGACKAHFICGATTDAISNLASSFFVPILENRGKSINKKTLSVGGKTCVTHTVNTLFLPSLCPDQREVSL